MMSILCNDGAAHVGAVGVICEALVTFPDDEAVQCQGLLALRMVLESCSVESVMHGNTTLEDATSAVQQSLGRRADSDGDAVLQILGSIQSQVQLCRCRHNNHLLSIGDRAVSCD